jgi:predicted ATPase
VGAALLSVLRALAERSRVVIAVDDLHWLDAPSAAALEFALRRLQDERVLAIVSLRGDEIESSFVSALERELRIERLELGPLSVAALHRVLAQMLGRSFPRPTLVRITQASGGNPLYALEIARALAHDEPADPTHVPVPKSLEALVRTRVGRLPPRTRAALLQAAALARPDIAAVAADDLAPAEEAELVRVADDGRIHFVHPLFASAVYSAAPLARRRATHRLLADAVQDAEERARHLALASDGPDASVAAELRVAASSRSICFSPATFSARGRSSTTCSGRCRPAICERVRS